MPKKAQRRFNDLRISAKRKKIQAKTSLEEAQKHNFFKESPVGEIFMKKDVHWSKSKKKQKEKKEVDFDE
jgi:hypothetical protein